MGSRSSEVEGQPTADDMPEDVAALYSWANLHGAKYRDYSASRREFRAQVRYRAARAMLERALKAQVGTDTTTAIAEGLAAGDVVTGADSGTSDHSDAATLAAAEQVDGARRAELAARAAVHALREEREVAAAHWSVKRQAQVYEESESRRRQLAGPQPWWPKVSGTEQVDDSRSDPLTRDLVSTGLIADDDRQVPEYDTTKCSDSDLVPTSDPVDTQNAPAWLSSAQALLGTQKAPAVLQSVRPDLRSADTLQDYRERVASRWFALRDVFDSAGPELPAMQPVRLRPSHRPLLAGFSQSGGVGKTSLLATLGRAFSSEGEEVKVVDTTSQALLAIYLGFDQRNDTVPRESGRPMPVSLVIQDYTREPAGEREAEERTREILRSGHGSHRLLIDLVTGSSWLIRRLVNLSPTVLVPVAPDMNSVLSIRTIERLFRGIVDGDGRPLLPFYVLNHFDTALPLHLDVREVFRRQLGDRLLPFTIRRSPLVSEALAEGMTVLDYAPESAVSQEYRNLARWLRSVSPPATEETGSLRWGER